MVESRERTQVHPISHEARTPLPRPGDVLVGKYRVERVIGEGGMGVVVAARHIELDDHVAIKFLLPEIAQKSDVLARFLSEAKAARRIRSEHVAKVTDVGVLPDTGTAFMVMEYLEGEDIGKILDRDGPFRPSLAVEYVLQACEALAEAHAAGIIHRDIKPSNLFLVRRADGAPCIKVLDFGVAKMGPGSGGSPSLTCTRAMIGTVVYAAPEQLESAKAADARSDIWSLGVTLYELLTGTFPFPTDDFASIVAHVLAFPPRPLLEVAPHLPIGLAALIERCLAKSPAARPADLAELAQELAVFGEGGSERSASTIQNILSTNPHTPGAQSTGQRVAPLPRPPSQPSQSFLRLKLKQRLGLGLGAVAVLLFGGSIALRGLLQEPRLPSRSSNSNSDRSSNAIAIRSSEAPPRSSAFESPSAAPVEVRVAPAPASNSSPISTSPAKLAPEARPKAAAPRPMASARKTRVPAHASDNPFGGF